MHKIKFFVGNEKYSTILIAVGLTSTVCNTHFRTDQDFQKRSEKKTASNSQQAK